MKISRDNGSFSNISLTECQDTLLEKEFGKQNKTSMFVGAFQKHRREYGAACLERLFMIY